MDKGTFITFSLADGTEHKRSSGIASRVSAREWELEQAYVRSHAAKSVHTRRKHITRSLTPASAKKRRPSLRQHRAESPNNQHELNVPLLPLLPLPSTPYQTETERASLQFYLWRCGLLLGKHNGQTSYDLWHDKIPQLAWQYKSVKHALISLSYGTQALLCDSPDGPMTTKAYYSSLKHQSIAMKMLADPSTPSFVLPIAAMVFRASEFGLGDWESAGQHSLAAVKMIDAIVDRYPTELGPALKHIRTVSQTTAEFFRARNEVVPFGMSKWTQAASDSDTFASWYASSCPIAAMYRSPGSSISSSPDASKHYREEQQQQQRFFNSLLELTVACHRLHQILDMLENVRGQWERAKHFTKRVHASESLRYARRLNRNTVWIYNRWKSTPYLKHYLTARLTRRFLKLEHLFTFNQVTELGFDHSAGQGHSPDFPFSDLASPSPFITTIEDFALWVANTEAAATPTNSDYDFLPSYDRHKFEELASSLTNAGHFFLVMTAGTDTQLRRDIQELAEVAKASASEQNQ